MPSSVDNRVVAMKFDNASFEQRIAQTLASLGKLKTSTDFDSSTKSLNNLTNAGKNFSLQGIGEAVENISSKFSVMSAVALSAINNIVTRAIDAGIKITSALTLDPLRDGLKEYETNMNSIQTILSNTKADHTSLDQVNDALSKLNTYSDQTIYNFAEMARNIGTFTAAGVNLDSSVNAIKGIANLAAISGSNSEQASTAMYQLSQALASGSVKLMDWNSVVNAGMGGEVFQKALFETGKSLKTIKDVPIGESFDEWKKKGNTFRDSLQDGWITTEVLTNTLSAFTGDLTDAQLASLGYTKEQVAEFAELGRTGKAAATEVKTITQLAGTIQEAIGSGWSESFKLVIGNFEEAKSLFTGINTVVGGFIQKFSDARNNLLTGWRWLGGREALLEGLYRAFKSLGSILTSISKAFRDVFPATTATSLFALTNRFREFMRAIQPSEQTLYKIRVIFRGLFSAISIGIEVIKAIAKTFQVFFRTLGQVNGGKIVDFFENIALKLIRLKTLLVDGGGIQDFMFKYMLPFARSLGSLDIVKPLGWIIDKLGALKDAIFGFFSSDTASDGVDKLGAASDRLADRWGWLITIGEKLADLGKKIGEGIKIAAEKIKDAFGGIFDKLAEAFGGEGTDKVLDAVNTGLFAALVLAITKFVKGGFKLDFGDGLLKNVSESFEQLTGTLSAMQTSLKADALLKIAIAIGVLTASVVVLSLIDSGKLTAAMAALAVGFGQLITAMSLLNKVVSGPKDAAKLNLLAAGLILLGGAILILSLAVKLLSTMDPKELATGLAGVGALLAEVTLAVNLMPDGKRLISTGIGIVGIAIGIAILAGAVKIMASMDAGDLAKGLAGVGAALAEITLAVNLMPTGMIAQGLGLIALAIGLNILAGAVALFGTMDFDTMKQGLIGVGIALGIITVAVNLMPPTMPLIGAGLLLIAAALNVMSAAIFTMGTMNFDTMKQGLGGIAAVLLILAIATNAMTGAIPGAIAIGLVSASLLILAAAVTAFANIGFIPMIIGLAGIAATMVVLGVAALLIEPILPALLGLGAALTLIAAGAALFGLAALGIGAAIWLIAKALQVLADIGVTAIKTVIEGVKLIAQALPEIVKGIVAAVVEFVGGLIEAIPDLIGQLGKVIEAILNLLIQETPKFVQAVVVMVSSLIVGIRVLFPQIMQAGIELLQTFLTGISNNIESITNTVIDIVTKFLDTLASRAGDLTASGLNVLSSFLRGIADNLQSVIDSAVFLIATFLNGVASRVGIIIQAGTNVIVALIQGVSNSLNQVVTAGANLIISFIEGISSNALKVINAAADTLVTFLNGLADAIRTHNEEIKSAGWNIASALIDGITGGLGDLTHKAVDSIKNVAGSMLDAAKGLFGINSPAKSTTSMSHSLAEGFVKGFREDTTAVKGAHQFGKDIVTTLNTSIQQVSDAIAGMDDFISPTITPVIDLRKVQSDAGKVAGLLSVASLDASVSFGQASTIAVTERQNRSNSEDEKPAIRDVIFEQTNNSPRELSAADIYRQTKSQIALAGKELQG